jgi:beta-lactamase class A
MDERFAMCSTFKLALAAAVLQRADQATLSLDTILAYTKDDMVPNAPVGKANLPKGGMTVREAAEAAQKVSDNVAANLLLKLLGGPTAFTQFFRSLGDTVTRIDRYEPSMNEVKPGDERDTTTPEAMGQTLVKILTGDVLQPTSRDLLIQWMIGTQTGAKRLRAGLPAAWRAGDKTGTGLNSGAAQINDMAIAWPPGRAPIIITSYLRVSMTPETLRDEDQAVLAEVGRIAAAWAS